MADGALRVISLEVNRLKSVWPESTVPPTPPAANTPPLPTTTDIVFADFEGTDYGAWKVEGTAFGNAPAQGALPDQKPVSRFLGHGLVNSKHGGDKATGRLTSPEFMIHRKFITFLIGGGGWSNRTCMNLVANGEIVRTATGQHTKPGGSGELSPSTWDVSELLGKTAHLEIVDNACAKKLGEGGQRT